MKHNANIVLKALLNKQVIKIQDQEFRYFKRGEKFIAGSYKFMVEQSGLFIKLNAMNWRIYDLTLGDFIEFCEDISHEDIVTIGANNALKEIK